MCLNKWCFSNLLSCLILSTELCNVITFYIINFEITSDIPFFFLHTRARFLPIILAFLMQSNDILFYVSKTFHIDKSLHSCGLLMALLATQSSLDLLCWFVLLFNNRSIRWALRNFVPIYTYHTLVLVLLRLIFILHDQMV